MFAGVVGTAPGGVVAMVADEQQRVTLGASGHQFRDQVVEGLEVYPLS